MKKSLEELNAIRDKIKGQVEVRRESSDSADKKYQVLVCGGTGCTSSGSAKIIEKLNEEIERTA